MLSRRELLRAAGAGGVVLAGGRALAALAAEPSLGPAGLPAGTLAQSLLDALPGKRPLIKRAYRPPNYETPVDYFNQPFTPNDAFFVRYHLGDIPEVRAEAWRLRIGGEAAERPLELTLDELKTGFEPVELVAVCQCSGNRRGLSQPHVPGVEWGHGAMGNARWKGARLKDVLARVGVRKEAVEIACDGADRGVVDKTPDFIKSLPLWKATDDNTLIAYEMNGQPLPHWNGFPARLVVPGWTATYWVKHLTGLELRTKPFDGFWMAKAYRIPTQAFPVAQRFVSQENETTTPITEMVVNSLITNLKDGQRVRAGEAVRVNGVAWDGGYGIRGVEASSDGGRTWHDARLGEDMGRFSWRTFSYQFTAQRGETVVLARATNRIGQTQVDTLIWNPAGYHNNVPQRIALAVA